MSSNLRFGSWGINLEILSLVLRVTSPHCIAFVAVIQSNRHKINPDKLRAWSYDLSPIFITLKCPNFESLQLHERQRLNLWQLQLFQRQYKCVWVVHPDLLPRTKLISPVESYIFLGNTTVGLASEELFALGIFVFVAFQGPAYTDCSHFITHDHETTPTNILNLKLSQFFLLFMKLLLCSSASLRHDDTFDVIFIKICSVIQKLHQKIAFEILRRMKGKTALQGNRWSLKV